MTDDVNNPDHYTVGGYEALDVIKAKLTPEEYRGFLKGNILKYLMRANYKGTHDKDCRKGRFYNEKLGEVLDADTSDKANEEVEVRLRGQSCILSRPTRRRV